MPALSQYHLILPLSATAETKKTGAVPPGKAPVLVRVVIQNFLKKPVISTVFKADE